MSPHVDTSELSLLPVRDRESISSTGMVSRLADRGIAYATSRPPMFADGWGPPSLLESLISRVDRRPPSSPVEMRWFQRTRTWRGLHYFRGYFPTPAMSLPLPPQSRTAYVELLLPEGALQNSSLSVCIHLAGTGDATYLGRRIIALPLAHHRNIGALILQNPFYGERQPSYQTGTKLRRVTDQFLMNLVTLEEACALVHWLRRLGVEHVGLTGYSMGGYIAALAAQRLSERLAIVPCAVGDRAVYPLVHSPLARLVDWSALQRDAPDDRRASEYMSELMSRFAISRHGDLDAAHRAILLGARHDAFILPEEVHRLARHWSQSELRWMDAGHTTGWLFCRTAIREAITDAFDQLEDAS